MRLSQPEIRLLKVIRRKFWPGQRFQLRHLESRDQSREMNLAGIWMLVDRGILKRRSWSYYTLSTWMMPLPCRVNPFQQPHRTLAEVDMAA